MILTFYNVVNSNFVYTHFVKVDKSGYKRKSNPFNVSIGAVNRRTLRSGAGEEGITKVKHRTKSVNITTARTQANGLTVAGSVKLGCYFFDQYVIHQTF